MKEEKCSYRLISLPTIRDKRGNLSFVENLKHFPFQIKRTYWIYDVPGGSKLVNGCAFKEASEFILPLSGSFSVELIIGSKVKEVELRSPDMGLFISNMIWRSFRSFTTNAKCLVLSSDDKEQADCIQDYSLYTQCWKDGNY